MKTDKLIPVKTLCIHYKTEVSFFNNLHDIGLVQIQKIERKHYIHRDNLSDIEKIIRLHHELDVNIEGIDVIFNLLKKLELKESELRELRNRLRLYEH